MTPSQKNNPLHAITLETLLTQLVAHYGWQELGSRIDIRCFTSDPSIKSSLTFLRKTPWARAKVETFYLDCHAEIDAEQERTHASHPPEA